MTLIERYKEMYSYDNWVSRELSEDEKYYPILCDFSEMKEFVVEHCIAIKECRGSYEIVLHYKSESDKKIKIRVIPFYSVKEANEYVIKQLTYITKCIPLVDENIDENRIVFGQYDSILIGRERNVFWSIQSLGEEKSKISNILDTVMQGIKCCKC